MFAYVLSSMLDGELMFAVLDVAEVFFPAPHCTPLRSVVWTLCVFSPPLSLDFLPFLHSLPTLCNSSKLAHVFASCQDNFVVLMYNDNKEDLI